ncbi:MAG: hypothetical protein N3I35_13795 [Clostridia bacterium]|nr:hypothetical protein [Clostridia bacterium]
MGEVIIVMNETLKEKSTLSKMPGLHRRLSWQPYALNTTGQMVAGVRNHTMSVMDRAIRNSSWYETFSRRVTPRTGWQSMELVNYIPLEPVLGHSRSGWHEDYSAMLHSGSIQTKANHLPVEAVNRSDMETGTAERKITSMAAAEKHGIDASIKSIHVRQRGLKGPERGEAPEENKKQIARISRPSIGMAVFQPVKNTYTLQRIEAEEAINGNSKAWLEKETDRNTVSYGTKDETKAMQIITQQGNTGPQVKLQTLVNEMLYLPILPDENGSPPEYGFIRDMNAFRRREVKGGFPAREVKPPMLKTVIQNPVFLSSVKNDNEEEPIFDRDRKIEEKAVVRKEGISFSHQFKRDDVTAISEDKKENSAFEKMLELAEVNMSAPELEIKMQPSSSYRDEEKETAGNRFFKDGNREEQANSTEVYPGFNPVQKPDPRLDIGLIADRVFNTLKHQQDIERERKGRY